MKLVFVIHGLRSGGAERVLTMIANYLVNNGYVVSILFFSNEKPFYELDRKIRIIKKVHKVKSKSLLHKFTFLFSRINLIKNVIKSENPDLVISFVTLTNIFSIIAAKISYKKIIVSEHTNYRRNKNDFLGFFRRIIYPYSDEVILLTNKDYEEYKFVKNKKVIRNPLILSNHHSLKREKIILGVGTLYDVKGFDLLIDAFYKSNLEDWKLIIVGEGRDREKLEDKIKQYNFQNKVELVGLKKDVEYFYKISSIFVLSSRTEGFPGVLCEAMGYGCSCIAFDCITGPAEIIDNNIDGILVEAENVEKLSEEIVSLSNDEEKREFLSRNAMKISKKLDINTICGHWIEVINKYKK